MLGRRFAKLRLEREAATGCHLGAGLEAFGYFHIATCTATKRYRASVKSLSGPDEYRRLFLNGLHCGFWNGYGHPISL